MKYRREGKRGLKNIIGPNVRRARMSFVPCLTQDQLSGRLAAKNIFLDRVAITKIENGDRCVFDFEIGPLAEVLNVEVSWLLGIKDKGGKTGMKGSKNEL